MWETAGKASTFFDGPLNMDTPVLADQQELTYIGSVWTLDVVWRICASDGG